MNKLKSKAAAVWASRVAKSMIASVGAVALLVVGVSVANGATAASDCKTLSYPLCARSVAAGQVVDNSLPAGKIVPADRARFLADTDTDVLGKGMKFTCPAKKIVNIGGSFKTGKTKVCSFEVPPGMWMLNTTAIFARTTAGVAGTRPQLALRVGASETAFGDDYGTILGAEISPSAGRELTGSAVKMVPGGSIIEVFGFGYNDDASSAGSGQITAAANVVAVRVG